MQEAVIYCRVSSGQQIKGDGLRRQLHCCLEWAKKNGYQVVAVFSEIGSAFRGQLPARLPIRKQAVRVAAHRGATLIVEAWDRLSRDFFFPKYEVITVLDTLHLNTAMRLTALLALAGMMERPERDSTDSGKVKL